MTRRRVAWMASAVLALVLASCSSGSNKAANASSTATGSTNPASTVPPTSASTTTASPASAQSLLRSVDVQQSDVPAGYPVQLYQGGDQVVNEVSLDLCSASYPSEELRTARRQVGVNDAHDQEVLSTEALLYRDADATAQAFSELRAARSGCPPAYVPGLVEGEPPLKTVFRAAPDASWPATPGVERLAFDTTVSDQQGHSERTLSVYLRRNRILLAVYFGNAGGPQTAIVGHTTIESIVGLFESRLAHLASSSIA